jgi:adhesin/invasin
VVVFIGSIGGLLLQSGSANLNLSTSGNTLVLIGGDAQQVPVNSQASSSLIVMAKDGSNQPIPGKTVTFSLSGGGSLSSNSVTTDSNGMAAVDFTAGGVASTVTITATSSVGSVSFTETVVALSAYTVQVVSGDAQSGAVGSVLGSPLKVKVLDGTGAAAQNVSITFSVQSGNGSFAGASSKVVTSDTSGFAQATYTLGTTAGMNSVRATITSAAAVYASFSESGTVSGGSAVDYSNSTLTLSQASVNANGVNTVTATITVRDAYGNLIPNPMLAVTGSFTGGLGSWSSSGNFVYSSNGTYTNIFRVGTTAGTSVFSGSIGGTVLSSGAVSLTLNNGGNTLAVVSGDLQQVPINSQASSPLTVIARDGANQPIAGKVVSFSVSGGGSLSAVSATTDANGLASVDFTAGGSSGTSTITASSSIGMVTLTETVVALSSYTLTTIAGDTQSAAVGSTLGTPLKVLVSSASGGVAPNVSVTFSVQSGNGSIGGLSSKVVTSDSSGYAQASFTLGTTGGTNSVRAAITSAPTVYNSFTETGTVPSNSPVDLSQSSIALSSNSVNANGVNTVTVSILVKDQYGNLIPNPGQSVASTFTPSNGSWATSSAFSYASTGTYTNTYKVSTTSGTVVFSGTIGGSSISSGTATLTLNNAGNTLSIVSGNLQQVPLNTQAASSLTVIARDGGNQPIAGKAVSFSIAGGGTLSASTVTTDSNGMAAVDFTAGGVASTYTITATSSVGSVSFTETVVALTSYSLQLVSGDAQSGTVASTLSSTPLKVLITDNSGAPASNISVTYSVQTGNGSFSGASSKVVTSDTSGYAQTIFTLGSTGGTNTVRATITAAPAVFTTFTETGTVPANSTVDLNNSTLTLSQSSAQANNANLITATVLVKDQYGNLIPNSAQTIATAFSPANGSWATTSTFSYSATGTYTNTFKVGSSPGTLVFSTTINGQALTSGSASLLLNTGSILASGGATLAYVSGNNQTTGVAQAANVPLKVQALDSLNIPISGQDVTFTVTSGGGNFSGSNSTIVTTGSDGIAQISYTGGASSGPIVVTASSLQGTRTFNLTVQDLSGYTITLVSGNSQSVYLNIAMSQMKVRVLKADTTPATSLALRFQCQSANCGTFSNAGTSIDVTTDSNGYASANYTSGTTAGTYTVRALLPAQPTISYDFTSTVTVNPSSSISLSNSTLALSSNSVSANGSDSVVATVTLKDSYGNIIPNSSASISLSLSTTSLGAWMGSGFVASIPGVYTRTYSVGTQTGSIVYTASVNGSALTSGTATLAVNANATPDLTKATIAALNTSLTADGASTTTIVVTLFDQYSNQITNSGLSVVTTTNTGTLSSMAYHSPTGTYRQVFTSPTTTGSGSATITLSTVGGSAVTGKTTTITLTTSAYSWSTSSITIPNRVFTAYGATGVQTLTMTLKDPNGNPIVLSSNPTIALTRTNVSGTLGSTPGFSAVNSMGNGVYTATLTPPTSCTTAPCVDSISATVTHSSINGGSAIAIGSAFRVQYTNAAITPAAAQSTVTLSSTSGVSGAGASTITLTVTLKTSTSASVNVGGYGANLAISNSFGSAVSAITDNDNGTYTATLYSPASPAAGTVNVKYNGTDISGSPASVTFYGPISLTNSTLAVSSNLVSGASSVQVTLTAKDAQGNFIPSTAATGISQIKFVVTNPAGGTTISGANSPTASSAGLVGGNATYYQTLTRASSPTVGFETANVSAQYSSDGGNTWNAFSSQVSLSITPQNLAGVTINCSNIATYRDTNLYVSGGTLTIDSWKDGAYYTSGSCANYGANHPFRFASVTVDSGGSINHLVATTADTYGLDIEVTGALTVNLGGAIDANNLGCSSNGGSGTAIGYGYYPDPLTYIPTQMTGYYPSYGNLNGAGGNAPYGSASNPNAPGAGGGRAATSCIQTNAGGLIRIKAGSIVNNGSIRANTTSGSYGSTNCTSSTGGGIKLVLTGSGLTGSGSISATGYNIYTTNSNFAGTGGRIAILGTASSFAGTISAAGGVPGLNDGTLYFDSTPPTSFTTIPHSIDLSSNTTYNQSTLPNLFTNDIVVPSSYTLTMDNATRTLKSLTNNGTFIAGTGALTVTNSISNSGTMTLSDGAVSAGSFTSSGTLTTGVGAISVTGNFTQTAGTINHSAATLANYMVFPRVEITAANISLTSVTAIGAGLRAGAGGNMCSGSSSASYISSTNLNMTCTAQPVLKGGNHYTLGYGNTNTATWGNVHYPFTYGGAGAGYNTYAGASGGGIVRLITPGILDLKGTIDVSGSNSSAPYGYGAGGAGGSIYIDAGTLKSTNNLGALNSTGGMLTTGTNGSAAGGLIRVYTASGSHSGTIVNSVAGGVNSGGNGAAGVFTETACSSSYKTPANGSTFDYCQY